MKRKLFIYFVFNYQLIDKSKIEWKCICTTNTNSHRTIFSVKWSKLNNIIATANGDNSISIFEYDESLERRDNEQGEKSSTPSSSSQIDEACLKFLHNQKEAHSQDCNCVDWNPVEPSILASCSDDGTIKIWSFENS
jgi:cytosolic iron-sulfur protein assembly protein CIAO1